jgi:hypothetical protein
LFWNNNVSDVWALLAAATSVPTIDRAEKNRREKCILNSMIELKSPVNIRDQNFFSTDVEASFIVFPPAVPWVHFALLPVRKNIEPVRRDIPRC